MPELIAHVGTSNQFRDGATLHAMTERRILYANAQRHLLSRDPDSNNNKRSVDGFLSVDDPLYTWLSLTSEYRFDHLGSGRLVITRLSDQSSMVIRSKRNYVHFDGHVRTMDVRQAIQRRRDTHFNPRRVGAILFGAAQREVWFGGRTFAGAGAVSAGWDEIESRMQIARADNLKWPSSPRDLQIAVNLPVANLSDDDAAFVEAKGVSQEVVGQQRTSWVDYRNLPGVDRSTAAAMADRNVSVDIRDWYLWEVKEILLEFEGQMNSHVSIERLSQELSNDPASLGYASMTDQEALDALNRQDRTFMLPVESAELLAWSAASGRLARLRRAAQALNPTENPQADAVASAAEAAYLLVSRDGTKLDLSLSDRMQMVDGLVAAGVLTEGDKASLVALATKTKGSRAEELFGTESTLFVSHIAHARSIASS